MKIMWKLDEENKIDKKLYNMLKMSRKSRRKIKKYNKLIQNIYISLFKIYI